LSDAGHLNKIKVELLRWRMNKTKRFVKAKEFLEHAKDVLG
jgi:hypothetical protein